MRCVGYVTHVISRHAILVNRHVIRARSSLEVNRDVTRHTILDYLRPICTALSTDAAETEEQCVRIFIYLI